MKVGNAALARIGSGDRSKPGVVGRFEFTKRPLPQWRRNRVVYFFAAGEGADMARMIAAAIGSSRRFDGQPTPIPLRCRNSGRVNRVTKSIVIPSLLCCWLASAPAWAIDCLSVPGDPKTGWYSWREIDGRKCWFKKTGAMPAKSQLHWATKVEEKPRPVSSPAAAQERTVPAAVPPPASSAEPVETKPATLPQFRTVRVKPVPVTSPRIGDSQVDLMNSARLSAVAVFGRARPKPGRLSPSGAGSSSTCVKNSFLC